MKIFLKKFDATAIVKLSLVAGPAACYFHYDKVNCIDLLVVKVIFYIED